MAASFLLTCYHLHLQRCRLKRRLLIAGRAHRGFDNVLDSNSAEGQ
jgi:hypothetical protein